MITQRADKQACTRKNRQELLKEMFEQLDNNGFIDSLTSRVRLRTVAIRKSLVKELVKRWWMELVWKRNKLKLPSLHESQWKKM